MRFFYGFFLCVLHVYFYYYFVSICAFVECICFFKFYIYSSGRVFVCICFNFVYSSKILCGIVQLDVGDATIFPCTQS
jgi:hypothetical protein